MIFRVICDLDTGMVLLVVLRDGFLLFSFLTRNNLDPIQFDWMKSRGTKFRMNPISRSENDEP